MMQTEQEETQFPVDVVGVGSPIIDQLVHVEEAFIGSIAGGKGGMILVAGTEMESLLQQLPAQTILSPGGSAGNTLFTLARLGMRTAFVGKTGNDEGGEFYRARFAELGGDISRFKIGDIANGRCLSLITPDSERTMRTDLGAAMTLDPSEVRTSDFAGCRHAHIEGYLLFNRDLMMSVLRAAKDAGCTISLDLASYETVEASADILPDLLRDYIDVVFANEDETAAFFGQRGNWSNLALQLAGYCRVAVVKLGKSGSVIASGNDTWNVEPVPARRVIDTTGAGDFWAAGFLCGWIRGLPLAHCGHLGSVLGSAVVEQLGTQIDADTWAGLQHHFASSDQTA